MKELSKDEKAVLYLVVNYDLFGLVIFTYIDNMKEEFIL